MRTIFLKEGIHGLYRGPSFCFRHVSHTNLNRPWFPFLKYHFTTAGSSAAVIASAGSWGVYWYAYSFLKNVISSFNENRLLRTSEQSLTSKLATPVIASAQEIGISPLHLFWSSSAASAAGILLTNPLWLVKTRLQLETDNSRYKGVVDASIRIFRQEKLHGLYRGLLPALVLTCEGALQFVVYEELRKHVINHKSAENSLLFFALGAASKVVASTAMYPAQVVRSRMMQRPVDGLNCSRDPMGLLETIRRTWKFEGVRGFYKGLVPNTLRTLPASALTFCLYERFLRELVDKF